MRVVQVPVLLVCAASCSAWDWSSLPPWLSSVLPASSIGVSLEVRELSAQAASLSCGWAGSGSANLTWTVDGEAVEAAEDSSEEGSSSLRLVWAELGRRPGEVVFVSCRGEAGASGGERPAPAGRRGPGPAWRRWRRLSSFLSPG